MSFFFINKINVSLTLVKNTLTILDRYKNFEIQSILEVL